MKRNKSKRNDDRTKLLTNKQLAHLIFDNHLKNIVEVEVHKSDLDLIVETEHDTRFKFSMKIEDIENYNKGKTMLREFKELVIVEFKQNDYLEGFLLV